MGMFICKFCNYRDGLGCEHVCRPEDVLAYIDSLTDGIRELSKKVHSIKNCVLKLLQETAESRGSVSDSIWLQRLWDAADVGSFWDAKGSEDFQIHWLATQWVLCDAFDLFREKGSLLDKLTVLRKRCDESKKTLGYDDSVFSLSPEDLIAGLERSNG